MKTIAVAKQLRSVGRTARSSVASYDSAPNQGEWNVDVAIGGLSEERRIELVEKLTALNDNDGPAPPVGDGNLHLRAQSGGPLGSGASFALAFFVHQLHQVGFDPAEIFTAPVTIGFAPLTEPYVPEPVKRTFFQKVAGKTIAPFLAPRLAKAHLGVTIAFASEADMETRRSHGDREYVVIGALRGLDQTAQRRINQFLTASGAEPRTFPEDTFHLQVRTSDVGSPLGALNLALKRLDDVINQANAGVTLDLLAAPAEDLDAIKSDLRSSGD